MSQSVLLLAVAECHELSYTGSPPPVPIIDSVDVAVFSLFEVEVNVSLLTNGGQSVTQYAVSWCVRVSESVI